MAKQKRRVITDAVEILDRLYFEGRPRHIAALDDERLKLDIAQKIYDLRTAAHLSQRALAARVGTTASVISRLEDTDYKGHSVSMLRRIAKALGWRVDVRFVAVKSRSFPYTRAWFRAVEGKHGRAPSARLSRNGKRRGAIG